MEKAGKRKMQTAEITGIFKHCKKENDKKKMSLRLFHLSCFPADQNRGRIVGERAGVEGSKEEAMACNLYRSQ